MRVKNCFEGSQLMSSKMLV